MQRKLSASLVGLVAYVVGAIIFGGSVRLAERTAEAEAQEAFVERFDAQQRRAEKHATDSVGAVLGLRGLFHAFDAVGGDAFRAFAGDLMERHAFVAEAAYYPRVRHADRAKYQEDNPDAGFGAGIVDGLSVDGRPRGQASPERPEYYPLLLRDLATEDRMVPGLDIAARAPALVREAVESGSVAIGPPRQLADGRVALEMCAADYTTNRVPAQAQDRKDAAAGVACIAIDLAALAGADAKPPAEAPRGLEALALVAQQLDRPKPPVPEVVVALPGWVGEISWTPQPPLPNEPRRLVAFGEASDTERPLEREHTSTLAAGRLTVSASAPLRAPWQQQSWTTAVSGAALALFIVGIGRSATARLRMNAVLQHRNDELLALKMELESTNMYLDEKVQERTVSLNMRNNELKQVLENVAAGVTTIDAELQVRGPYSPAFVELVGEHGDLVGKPICDLLFREGVAPPYELARHRAALGLVASGDEMQWELTSGDLLDLIHIGDSDAKRTVAIKYAPVFDSNDDVQRIVVVATDMTEVLQLREDAQKCLAAAGETSRILAELVQADTVRAEAFFARCRKEVGQLRDRSRDDVLRTLHTFKGNARALGLKEIAGITHDVESQVIETSVEESEVAFAQLADALERFGAVADEYFYAHATKVRTTAAEVAGRRIAAFGPVVVDAVKREIAGDLVGARALFDGFRPMVERLGDRLGKRVELVHEEPELDVLLPSAAAQAVGDAAVHVLRNALDHGLEDPEARGAASKPEVGTIAFEIALLEEHVEFRIRDDGRGISPELLESAKLFEAGFSTAAQVTDVSGRGVGLSAVREGLRDLGGDAQITSRFGHETAVVLRLPASAVALIVDTEGVRAPTTSPRAA